MKGGNADTAIDIMYAIALRAQQLCDMPTRQLRALWGGYDEDTKTAAVAATRGMTKGKLVEAILTEEFQDAVKRLDEERR